MKPALHSTLAERLGRGCTGTPPADVPALAVHSRNDGMAPWQLCLDSCVWSQSEALGQRAVLAVPPADLP